MEVLDWVLNPNNSPPGKKDHLVFGAAVEAIFDETGRSKLERELIIRDLLRYLLLRRSPADDIIAPDIPPKLERMPEAMVLSRDSWMRMCERYLNKDPDKPSIFSALILMQQYVKYRRVAEDNAMELVMLVLSLWLGSPTLKCSDLGTKRACVRLYQSSAYIAQAHGNRFVCGAVNFVGAVLAEIVRMCELHYPSDVMIANISYFGAFASLVRFARTYPNEKINSLLETELSWLKTEIILY